MQDVEIKKMSGNATYGFVLFYDLLSAVAAKQFMDGENIHGHNIRVSLFYTVNALYTYNMMQLVTSTANIYCATYHSLN